MLTPSKAFEIASQWGSFIRAGDPGAVFYTFPLNDARPLSEAHRAECLAYVSDLLSEETGGDTETRGRAAELAALQVFFQASPIGDGVSKPEAPNAFRLDTGGAVQAPETRWGDLDAFTQGYIEALFFTEEESLRFPDTGPGLGGRMLDGRIGFSDLSPETLAAIIADCAAFQDTNGATLAEAYGRDYEAEQAGRDFWFTRNGHGVGYWDRDALEPDSAEYESAVQAMRDARDDNGAWGRAVDVRNTLKAESVGERLSQAARRAGSVDAYLGDDGRVYL